jgi:hypothetical protein
MSMCWKHMEHDTFIYTYEILKSWVFIPDWRQHSVL